LGDKPTLSASIKLRVVFLDYDRDQNSITGIGSAMSKEPAHINSSSWTGLDDQGDAPGFGDAQGASGNGSRPLKAKTLAMISALVGAAESYNSYQALAHHVVYKNGMWIDRATQPMHFAYAQQFAFGITAISLPLAALFGYAWLRGR
jgi:hypothetical protein